MYEDVGYKGVEYGRFGIVVAIGMLGLLGLVWFGLVGLIGLFDGLFIVFLLDIYMQYLVTYRERFQTGTSFKISTSFQFFTSFQFSTSFKISTSFETFPMRTFPPR